jgi:hypothetical protein
MTPANASVAALLAEIEAGNGLSLSAAARLFPGRRGATVNPSTVFRWVTRGTRLPNGDVVRLDAVRVGGRWLTSRAAVARMIAALTTGADPLSGGPVQPVRTPTDRQKAAARAAEQLKRMGA